MISQKEYLKKYLSSGKEKKKVKKKKPNLGSKTVKIIDDDIDLNRMRAIEDGEFDILNNTEDAPQIAGIVDERGPVDFSDKRRWKIITDDGYGDIAVTSVERNDESGHKNKSADSNHGKSHSGTENSDFSPHRKSTKNSGSDRPPRKKYSSKKKQRSPPSPVNSDSGTEESDFSPPRKSRKDSQKEETRGKKLPSKKSKHPASSPIENHPESEESDFSPPRRSRKNSDSDEPHRKKLSLKKNKRSAFSAAKNNAGTQDSDFSPPRRPRKNSNSEESLRKKSSKKSQNRSGSEDSDFSPPRRTKKESDSDLSPPRNSRSRGKEKEESRSREEYSSNSRKRFDKQGENSSRDSRHRNYDEKVSKISRNRSAASPYTRVPYSDANSLRSESRNDYSHRTQKYGNNTFEYDNRNHRSREDHREKDAPEKLPRNRRKTDGERRNTNSNIHSQRGGNNSESDLNPPREKRQKSKNLDSESNPEKKNTFKNYQEMTAETSGFGQAPVLRDRKTGRRRDLAAEAREKKEKDEKRQELEEKYAQWGRGLKQVEDRQEKLDRDLYEMSKPLARYADDADLERELKAQEREGDPMLAYMKRKQIKEGKQEPEKPKYNGPSMPNRFGIRPGYRWDGVDRSNGYEKKWFDAQNARKAVQEEAYKWSTADM